MSSRRSKSSEPMGSSASSVETAEASGSRTSSATVLAPMGAMVRSVLSISAMNGYNLQIFGMVRAERALTPRGRLD